MMKLRRVLGSWFHWQYGDCHWGFQRRGTCWRWKYEKLEYSSGRVICRTFWRFFVFTTAKTDQGGVLNMSPISLGELLGMGDITLAVDPSQDDPRMGCVIYANGESDKPVLFLERSMLEKVRGGDTSVLKSLEIVELPPSMVGLLGHREKGDGL